jgi:predicted DNA-binding transcriptional regulator AlpA
LKESFEFDVDEYLTVKELCGIIKYSPRSIYNLICQKKLIYGKHYIKLSHKKILFKKSAIQEWIKEQICLVIERKPIKKALKLHPKRDFESSNLKI